MVKTIRPTEITFRGETIELEPVAWMVGTVPTYDHLPVARGDLTPLHEITDWGHALALAEAIADEGWRGAPLVVWGDQLLTGTHRYMACQIVGLDDGEIPMVDIADVFAEAGQDLAEQIAETGIADEFAALSDLLRAEYERYGYGLPAAIRARYGIDWE